MKDYDAWRKEQYAHGEELGKRELARRLEIQNFIEAAQTGRTAMTIQGQRDITNADIEGRENIARITDTGATARNKYSVDTQAGIEGGKIQTTRELAGLTRDEYDPSSTHATMTAMNLKTLPERLASNTELASLQNTTMKAFLDKNYPGYLNNKPTVATPSSMENLPDLMAGNTSVATPTESRLNMNMLERSGYSPEQAAEMERKTSTYLKDVNPMTRYPIGHFGKIAQMSGGIPFNPETVGKTGAQKIKSLKDWGMDTWRQYTGGY
jgi:hypothetical protein